MPACRVCTFADRNLIDQQIVAGRSLRNISADSGLSLGSLHRHKAHIREALANAQATALEENAARGSILLARVEKLVGEAEQILAAAKAKGDFRASNGALIAAGRLLDLCGRLSGELHQANAAGGSLHLHKHEHVTIGRDLTNDKEWAMLVGEATHNFDPVEIARLRAIVHNARAMPLLSDSNQSS